MNVFIEMPPHSAGGAGAAGCTCAPSVGSALWMGRAAAPCAGQAASCAETAPAVRRARGGASGAGASAPGAAPASQNAACDFDLDEPEPYATAAHAYVEELAFDRRRARRRKVARAARFTLACVAIPMAAVVVFVVAYALTFILNGATPQQVADTLIDLARHIESLLMEVAAGLGRHAAHV